DRDREPDLGVALPDVGGDRALADGGGAGENGQPADFGTVCPVPVAPSSRAAVLHVRRQRLKRSTSAAIWFAPRPRTRRDSEMPISSMIWRARTLPTPGRASSSADTLILPITSSVWPSLITSPREPWEYFRRFFTSARARRAAAA